MAPLIVFVLVLAVVGAAAYLPWRAKQRRREASGLWAMQHDMAFSAQDLDVIPSTYPFHLFRLGDRRGCHNVMTGTWQGLPVKAADYWYSSESSDGKGTGSRHDLSVVIADLSCDLPHVGVVKETVFDRVAGPLRFDDIDVESEAFNRLFHVVAEDREFAYQLLDARMIRWLESTGGEFGFEVAGPNLLVWSDRRPPSRLIPLLGCARLFHDHIPRLVWNQYGRGPSLPDIPVGGSDERSTT